MRLGLALPHYDMSFEGAPASWEAIRRIAMLAERSGYDSLWVSDHLTFDWSKYGADDRPLGVLECWTTLAAVAAVTKRVRVGSLVLGNDLRHPGLVAKMIATLDLLSEGRVEAGMGAGWYEPEYRAAGMPFQAASARIARLAEAAAIVARLLEGEDVRHDGRYYQMSGAICRPLPRQTPRPAIWFGGKGDRLLGAAARAADGWNCSWMASVDAYKDRSAAADRACEGAGRDPATLRRSVGVYVVAGTDDADVRRRVQRLRERTPEGILPLDTTGTAVSLEELGGRVFVGTVAEIAERLGAFRELGVEEVIVGLGAVPFQLTDEEDVELIGSELGPALR